MFYRSFLVFLIFIHYLYAFDIAVPSTKRDNQINSLSTFISKCFPDVKSSIFISSLANLSEEIYKTIGSLTLLQNSINYSIPADQKLPISLIIMTLTYPEEMNIVLVNETWRSFDQFFVVLDGNNYGCDNALSFLIEAWKNDILNVIFICLDQDLKIYTFNPFTNSASSSWMKILEIPGIDGHPWTLFQSNSANDVVCKELFFDKTENFGGYFIKLGAQYIIPYISFSIENGVKRFEGFDFEILSLLFSKLNISILFDESDSNILETYRKQVSEDLIMKLGNKTIDFAVNSIVFRDNPNEVELTYAFYQTGFSVITQYYKLQKVASHLFSFLPFSIMAMFLIASFVVFLLLRLIFRDPFSRNMIDVIRVFLNLPLPTLPVTNRGRIIFGLTVMSFTFANVVIQSNMNTVLTSRNTARNIEELKDLVELNYRVYTRRLLGDDMKKAGVSNIETIYEVKNCSQLKKKEAFAAKEITLFTLKTESCHMPRKPILPGRFLVYYARHNWPIFPRINKNLLMLIEAGLTDFHIEKVLQKYQQPKIKPEQYQVITMDHMKFTFYGFVALNFFSVIVFCIELFIARLSK